METEEKEVKAPIMPGAFAESLRRNRGDLYTNGNKSTNT